MRYHLTPVRMAVISKSTNKSSGGCEEMRTPVHCWWECKWLSQKIKGRIYHRVQHSRCWVRISDRERQTLNDLTSLWNLIPAPPLPKIELTENRVVIASGRGWRVGKMGGGGQKVHMSSYKLN